ncbi:hypothetical protein ACFLZY_03570, partial [Patescibacteria group bacterium]
TFFGWEGYCLEKDNSMQLFGSKEPDDQPCLTWYPVDQLKGSTDIFAKNLQAGYAEGDTYYCAEPGVSYDIGVSSEIACGEWTGFLATCNQDWGDFIEAIETADDHKCLRNVYCPDGFFAVMTGCEGLSTSTGNESDQLCTQGFGHDHDCPFLCVPKLAYLPSDHPEYPNGECYPNAEAFGGIDASERYYSSGQMEDIGEFFWNSYSGVDTFIVKAEKFEKWRALFQECKVSGISSQTLLDYIHPHKNIEIWPKNSRSDDVEYRDLKFDFQPYLSCESVVQVAQGSEHAAWTNRTWQDRDPKWSIPTNPAELAYSVDTMQFPFGRATDITIHDQDFDASPLEVVMCQNTQNRTILPSADGISCAGGVGFFDLGFNLPPHRLNGEDARVYMNVVMNYPGDLPWIPVEDWCATNQPDDPECDVSSSRLSCDRYAGPEECNVGVGCEVVTSTGGSCTDDIDCETIFGFGCVNEVCTRTRKECTRGPFKGWGCENVADCQLAQCIYLGENSCGTGNDTNLCAEIHECVILEPGELEGLSAVKAEGEGPDSAIQRLQQIFAKSIKLYEFNDGFKTLNSGVGGAISFVVPGTEDNGRATMTPLADLFNHVNSVQEIGRTHLGTHEESESTEWDWDITNTSTVPAPEIISVGDCVGIQCYEGTKNAFSINGLDQGLITGEGTKKITVSFFMHADKNQMPIRNVIVDWGNDRNFEGDKDWPKGSQFGSTTDNNYYTNHRGLNPDGESYCDLNDEWGMTNKSCEKSYRSVSNDYSCTRNMISKMQEFHRDCEVDEVTGHLIN